MLIVIEWRSVDGFIQKSPIPGGVTLILTIPIICLIKCIQFISDLDIKLKKKTVK